MKNAGIKTLVVLTLFLFFASSARASVEIRDGQIRINSGRVLGEDLETPKPSESPKPSQSTTPESHVEIIRDGLKVNVENNNGKVQVEVEQHKPEDKTKTETRTLENENEIESEASDGGKIRIASGSGDLLSISKKGVEALTSEKVEVDVKNNKLKISNQPINVTPDQIVTSFSNSKITLEMQNGKPVYKVEGTVTKKLLGIFDVNFAQGATVSAETGVTTPNAQSLVDRILQALSF